MVFVIHVTIAFLLVALGALVSTASGISITFLIGTFSAQIWLFFWALKLRERRIPRFDMVVASEMLIAFGVFSLILGIIVSGVTAFRRFEVRNELSVQVLWAALTPFAEGLAASGLAPLLASILRQIEVLKYGTEEEVRRSGEPDLPGLVDKVDAVKKALDDFAVAWSRSKVILEGASGTLMASADTYERAAKKIDETVGDLNASLDRAEDSLSSLDAKSDAVADALEELATKTAAFSTAAKEGTTLLTELQKLIESVTNFIRPADAGNR
jgi:hypothetical protein